MNLQRMIDRVYGVNLPIEGGLGESIDDPIIFEDGTPSYIALEYRILELLADLQGYKLDKVQQIFLKKGKKFYDKITVKFTCTVSKTFFHRHYYFDISQCFKKGFISLIHN